MTNRRLQKAFGKLDTLKKTRDPEVPGILGFTVAGIETVEVGNRSSYVWVRLRSNTNEVIQAFNDQVSPVYGLPVVVVRDETDRNKYRIKGKDLGVYQSWNNTSYLPRHGNQHSFNPSGGGGGDVTFVYNQQFMPLAVHPSGSSGGGNVYVQPYAYYQGAQWKYAGGTGTASLLPYKPTGTSARMVLVYLDNDGNPQLLPGDTYFVSSITGNAAVLPYVPTLSGATDIPLAAIRLVSGTSTLVWDNIYDLRPIIVSDGFIPTGSSGHTIQDDGTPLASRSALNFVGSGFAVYNTAGATNVSGTAMGGSTTNNYYSLPNSVTILDDHVFKVSGTSLDFTNNIAVAVTGSVAFISSTATGGGGSTALVVQDDNVYKITGSVISFDKDLAVSVVGTVAHVDIPANTFASGTHTHPAGAASPVNIFDNSVFKTTGTAISFDDNLSVAVTGTVAYVSSSGGSGYTQGTRVYDSDGQTLNNNELTAINFDSERYDTDGIHSGTSTQLYCNTAGKYLIMGGVQWASNVNGQRILAIRLNGATFIAINDVTPSVALNFYEQVSTIWDMGVGDYVELVGQQNSSSSLAVESAASYSPEFMMQKIG